MLMLHQAITPAPSRFAHSADLPARVIARRDTPDATVEIIEWHWPAVLETTSVENDLMIELMLPPLAEFAQAHFPTVAPGSNSAVGTLFVRYPGLAISTRAEGYQVRVLRCTFSPEMRQELLGNRHAPSLAMLQRLLNIRNEPIRSAMRMLRRELEQAECSGSRDALAALVRLLAVELSRLLDSDVPPKAGGRLAPWQFRRLRERLSNGAERPSVTDLAALCGISVRHLHRQFLNLTGVTVSDYIENELVSRAKAMLAGSDAPIKLIAAQTGFDHANSFARAFRRVTGMSPIQYRQHKRSQAATQIAPNGTKSARFSSTS